MEKKIKQVRQIIKEQTDEGNNILITVDFKNKTLGNLYVFRKKHNYEITETIQDSLELDPLFHEDPLVFNEEINIDEQLTLKNIIKEKKKVKE